MKTPWMKRSLLTVIVIGWCLPVLTATAFSPKEIYQKTGPGVVFIFASQGSSSGSGGTGSIIREDGLVITNAHLFTHKGSSGLLSNITIFLKPKKLSGNAQKDLTKGYKGQIVAYDLALDLALVKMMGVDVPLHVVDFADSENVVIGEKVYAIGHPEQGGLWSLTTGVVSAYWEDYGGVRGKDLFQTDASINRGNSGGPLLDEQGTMIGINSMIARQASDGLTITDVNFSIKSNVALKWLDRQGYHFAAAQPLPSAPEPTAAAPSAPKASPDKVPPPSAAAPETPAAPPAQAAPQTPAKPSQPVTPPPAPKVETRPQQDQPQEITGVHAEPQEKPSTPSTVKPPQSQPTQAPPPKTEKQALAQGPSGGQILTEKKPYSMDRLLEDMRDMEDMMDDMKKMMDDYKQRRKK
jgi:serine protease Do